MAAIDKQHQSGKLTARERIFSCLTKIALKKPIFLLSIAQPVLEWMKKPPADGVVTGYGTIDGRPVFVYSQDFTVMGGSLGKCMHKKYVKLWTWH